MGNLFSTVKLIYIPQAKKLPKHRCFWEVFDE